MHRVASDAEPLPCMHAQDFGHAERPCPCAQLINKRPLSPDVIEIDGKSPHYKFPLGAISSITNRATGVALSVGGYWTSILDRQG